ncbi:MAG TPA: TonB-dependent receptor [Gemmatimonadaceae bacterium]
MPRTLSLGRLCFVRAASLSVALLASPRLVLAQTTTGALRGYTRDAVGAPIDGAQIVARNLQMNVSRNTLSNSDGFYNIAGLRPGAYEVTVRRIGFSPQTRAVQIQIGQTQDLDVQLTQTATTLQGVVVTATTAQETRTSEVGTNVTRDQIQNLPNFERNVLDFASLAPGISPQAVNSTNKVISAAGQPPEAVNLFVDGATYKNDVLRGGVAGQDASKGNPFPQSAVQEFRVITQNYKAEYQKASSAIITATTRSGGNQWEGDAFASGVGNSYVAKDAFAAEKGLARPAYKRLQAGASLGGPLAKDKLFFFGTYELNFRDEPQYVTLGGDAAQAPAGLNPQQYTGQFQSRFREHLGFAKATWAKSDRSTIDFSADLRKDDEFRGFGGQTAYEAAEDFRINVLTGVMNWKYAGDRWLNEAQINGQNFLWNPTPINPGLIAKDYQGIIRIGGEGASQKFTQNRLSLRDDITRSGVRWSGDHVFKVGASIDFLGYQAIKNQQEDPVFRFNTSNNFAFPFQAAFGFGNPKISTSNNQIGVYAQDDWSVTQKLLINLGLRWDVETNMNNNTYVTPQAIRDSITGPLRSRFLVDRPVLKADGTCCDIAKVDVIDELGGFDRFISNGRSSRPIYLGAWQPRLGASYDLHGDSRTVLFGGGGIYFDRDYWNSMFDEMFRRQYHVLTVNFNATGPNAACPNCVQWDPKYFNPTQLRTLAGTAGLDEIFMVANDLKPPKTYQFSAGVRQAIGAEQLTLSYNGSRGFNGFNFVKATNFGGLTPTYAQAFITDDRVRTWYDALQLQIQRPLRGGARWGGSLAYTFSHADNQGRTDDFFWDFDDHHPTVADMPRQRALNNQTHTVVANGVFRLPYDFLLSSIVNLGSGLTVIGTDQTNGAGYGLEHTYVFTPPGRPFFGLGHVFNTENVDLRVQKDFPMLTGQNVGLVVDIFNAFNTANFGCYDTRIGPASSPNSNFGQPGCAGLGRRLQIGLRYGYRNETPGNGPR